MVFSPQVTADLWLSILGRGLQADQRRSRFTRHKHRDRREVIGERIRDKIAASKKKGSEW
jgi:hypothetical protein